MHTLSFRLLAVPLLLVACGGAPSSSELGRTNASAAVKATAWPEARGYARQVYVSSLDRVLVIGGESVSSWGLGLPGLGGAWAFDAGARRWDMLTASNPRFVDVAAYDSKHDRVIAYVSTVAADPNSFGFFPLPIPISEIWALDVHTGVWENRQPAGAPPSLFGAGAQAIYDSKHDKFIVALGANGVQFFQFLTSCNSEAGCDASLLPQLTNPDVWAYDYETNAWTRHQTAAVPEGRNCHGLAYDEGAGRVILFGGSGESDNLADTWAYDYEANTWTRMWPARSPPKRCYGPLTYDKKAGKTVLFGGLDMDPATGAEVLLGDTWTYDFGANTWTERHPSGAPPARAFHDLAYSDKANVVVMFGGGVDRFSFTDETWLYRTEPDRWVQVTRR